MRDTEMEQNALRAVINLVVDNQLVNLTELLEHCVIDECLYCSGRYWHDLENGYSNT